MGDAEQSGEDLVIIAQPNLVPNDAGSGAHQRSEGTGVGTSACTIARAA